MRHHIFFICLLFVCFCTKGLGQNLEVQGDSYITGKLGIGTSTPSEKLVINDTTWQLKLNNSSTGGDNWYVGSSSDKWLAGGGKFILSNTNSSGAAALVVDINKNVGISTIFLAQNYILLGVLMSIPYLVDISHLEQTTA